MEKIYLKPESREIMIKGDPADGHLDAFSYDPAGDQNARRLGSLFVVGHVHHPTDDIAYSINLISALAKREYYAVPGLAPREAFTRTLKKVNEVVEDFFEHEGLTVNIGMFAVAGEQIFLSRLGKFKLLLARDNRVIDVFNNVDLFDKEHLEQKQFSSVVSGKVGAQDRLLAFYPSKPLAARERYLKDYLVKLSPAEFVDKLHEIKTGKADFACAAVRIDLEKVTEIASEPAVQPQELKEQPVGAVPPRLESILVSNTQKPKIPAKPVTADTKETASIEPEPPVPTITTAPQEVPRIIATEFSRGLKSNPFAGLIRRAGFAGLPRRTGAILAGTAVVVLAGTGYAVRGVWTTSPEVKAARTAFERAQSAFTQAQPNLSGSDSGIARRALASILADLAPALQNDKTKNDAERLTAQITAVLDTVDQAQEAVPTLWYQVPAELGTAEDIAVGQKMFALISSGDSSRVLAIASGSLEKTYDLGTSRPVKLFAEETAFSGVGGDTLSALNSETPKSFTLAELTGAIDTHLYGTNLYILKSDGIARIADAGLDKTTADAWLKAGAALPADAMFMTVDGSIYVLAKDGTLAVYYRGEKKGEYKTGLAPHDGDLFFTSTGAKSLYLADRSANRVYAISKESMTLSKTLKISGDSPLVSATANDQDMLYILTKDNKIWKL